MEILHDLLAANRQISGNWINAQGLETDLMEEEKAVGIFDAGEMAEPILEAEKVKKLTQIDQRRKSGAFILPVDGWIIKPNVLYKERFEPVPAPIFDEFQKSRFHGRKADPEVGRALYIGYRCHFGLL